jgi:uncharacterized OsmC-like protein
MSQATTTVKNGVDLDKLHEFVEYATENPDEVQFELSSRSISEGRLFHSLAKVDAYSLGGEEVQRETREYTFPMGAWKEVESAAGFVDPTDRMEPIEVALAALSSCLNVAVGLTAVANEIDLDAFETHVTVDFDPRVVFLIHDVDESEATFDDIQVEIEVSGEDLSHEQIETLQAGARRSPVWNLMRLSHNMEPDVSEAKTPVEAN